MLLYLEMKARAELRLSRTGQQISELIVTKVATLQLSLHTLSRSALFNAANKIINSLGVIFSISLQLSIASTPIQHLLVRLLPLEHAQRRFFPDAPTKTAHRKASKRMIACLYCVLKMAEEPFDNILLQNAIR